ncbi:MAG: ATP-binding cassette domain-containing protein, partial [Desulfovibrio sp.]|nr:ATP-binding cassette domain-containing protein [Desulfovibrio sp.]
ADFYPHQLSGGMRKRAGLARAIIAQPKILLCDEPTSGLDPLTAAKMDQLLLALHKKYPTMTIVTVSHDLSSLFTIADWVVVLKSGTSVFTGTVEELKESQNMYLQQFLNRSPICDAQDFSQGMRANVQQALQTWLNT